MVVLLAVAGQHDGLVGVLSEGAPQAAQHRRVVAAGQVGAADRAREEQVAGEQQRCFVGGKSERDRAGRVPGHVVDAEAQPGERRACAPSTSSRTSSGSPNVTPARPSAATKSACHQRHRVGELRAVGGVHVGRARRGLPQTGTTDQMWST